MFSDVAAATIVAMQIIDRSGFYFVEPERRQVLDYYTPWVCKNFSEGDIFLTQNLWNVEKPISFIKARLRKVSKILGGRHWDRHDQANRMPVFAVLTASPHLHMHAFVGVHPMDKLLGTSQGRVRHIQEQFKETLDGVGPCHVEVVRSPGVLAVTHYMTHKQDNAEVLLEVTNLPLPAPMTSHSPAFFLNAAH